MNLIVMERLRPLVGSKGWDYCVLWKLSEDQRSLEWMICCCGGAEIGEDKDDENGGKELLFPVSAAVPCRDVMFQHPRTKSCDLLAHQPSSIPLDSGYHLIHAQAFISNQPKWLKFSNSILDLDSSNHHLGESVSETVGTRVLVPVPGGLVELFVAKQVSEDQHVIDFITAQLNMSMEQDALLNQSNMEFSVTNGDHGMSNDLNQKSYLGNLENGQKVDLDLDHDHDHDDNNHHFHPLISPASDALDNLNLPYDISADRIRLSSNSPMNFLHQFHTSSADTRTKSDVFFEESDKPMDPFKYSSENGLQEMDMMNNSPNMHIHFMEPGMVSKDEQGNNNDKDSAKRKIGMSDSVSDCSDQIDDEDMPKYQRRSGKGPQSKNLMAERKRRKKLNDRLYHLRALVPKISKLDRASILGDAIEFVKELQKQAKELQDELEENSDDEGPKNTGMTNGNNSVLQSEIQNRMGCKPEQDHKVQNMGVYGSEHREPEISNEKTQQMEPQVEVCQIDGNEFFLKVFCEYKAGGFVRLMEALSSLGLVVTNANVTRFRGLVSNVFRVEMRDCEMIQADHVRDSLLELTRDPYRDVGKPTMEDEMCNLDFHQQQQQQQDLYSHNHNNGHHLHHLHHLHN